MLASLLLTLTCAAAAFADPHGHARLSRHHQVAKRSQGEVQLFKRFSNARFTFYDVGLGACGKVNKPGDFIVALNSQQYGGGYPGPNCFKTITISYGGKTAQATIMDECPGCPYGGLDFSRGLFDFFASEDKGVLYGEWSFGGGGGDGGGDDSHTTSPKPKPKPTTTHHTTTKHTTTDTPTPTPSPTHKSQDEPQSHSSASQSSSHSQSSAQASSSSIDYDKGIASGIAVPTDSPSSSYADGQLQGFSEAIINIGALINAAHEIQN